MSPARNPEPRDPHEDGRQKLKAVVGSHRIEEEIFGRAFDGKVVSRIWDFVRPYRREVVISVSAVIVFTLSAAVDPAADPLCHRPRHGQEAAPASVLDGIMALFALAICINFIASRLQEGVTGQMAENVLFDIRRKMFDHLQRVSLSFMDKTEVGRLMSACRATSTRCRNSWKPRCMSVGDIDAAGRHRRGDALARLAACRRWC